MAGEMKLSAPRLWSALALIIIPQFVSLGMTIPVPKPPFVLWAGGLSYFILPLIASYLLTVRDQLTLERFGTTMLVWLLILVFTLPCSMTVFFFFLAFAR